MHIISADCFILDDLIANLLAASPLPAYQRCQELQRYVN
jgi:hypothetical protein